MQKFRASGDSVVVVFEGIPVRGDKALEIWNWKQKVRAFREEEKDG